MTLNSHGHALDAVMTTGTVCSAFVSGGPNYWFGRFMLASSAFGLGQMRVSEVAFAVGFTRQVVRF